MIPILKKNFLSLLLVAFLLLSGVSSCKKEKAQGVPLVAVDIRLYSTDPSFVPLNPVGGWAYVAGGNRGILVYRSSQTDFVAFDRTCTYNPADDNELIKVDANNNVIAVDAHCGSKFFIANGSVSQGPATLPLKAYQTSYDGTMLHIFN
jgi:Rieske Fe-S protein